MIMGEKNRPIDRIKALAKWYIEHKAIKSMYIFEHVCGFSKHYVKNLCATKGGNCSVETVASVYRTFKGVNLHWLVLGEGSMFTVSDEEAISNALAATMDYSKEIKIKKLLDNKLLNGLTKEEKLELFDRLM